MGILALILIILAVLLFVPGLIFGAVKFLLWVGIVLAIIAAIVFLIRTISGRRT